MSNSELREATGLAAVESKPASFPAMLHKYKDEIARALPRHMNADRLARIALTCFRDTPALAKCAPASIFAAVIKASQLGLEPGLNGRAYLIPYKGECQFVPGWKGLVELANRTGRAAVWTGGVFAGDEFDYQLGDSPFVRHRPGAEDDPANLQYTYAVGRIKGNDWPVIEVWTTEKILKHRNRYNKVGLKHYSYEHWEMYARKVPLMQVLKYLPSSPELEQAMSLANAADSGVAQGLTIDGVLSNTYEPPQTPDAGYTNGAEKPDADNAAPTYAQLMDGIKSARDGDALDLVVDQFRHVADEKQRAELDVEQRAKRKTLAP